MRTIIKAPPGRNPQSGDATTNRPENTATGPVMPYSLFQCLVFVTSALTLLFAMCATGRPGA
jgi:hypothetical protein